MACRLIRIGVIAEAILQSILIKISQIKVLKKTFFNLYLRMFEGYTV